MLSPGVSTFTDAAQEAEGYDIKIGEDGAVLSDIDQTSATQPRRRFQALHVRADFNGDSRMALDIADRPIDDPTPGPGPDPIELFGPIEEHWKKLGGKSWGIPANSGHTRPDGTIVVHFKPHPAGVATKSICYKAGIGARILTGAIRLAWLQFRGGNLGAATADPQPTHDGVGQFQTFEHALYVWHPSTGAHEVHGAIQALYLQLGGSRWGYPTTDETASPDGRARSNHFRDPATGAEKSIYWTRETGAQPLIGYIRSAWLSYKGHAWLGYPTGGELNAHDGVGRYQVFEHSVYNWHPSTGAHEVHGAIQQRYAELGGSAWGYPITDETKASDGVGRFNHFRDVATGEEKSIYWHPDTGAHPVEGLVRTRWSEMGWERSYLGYPRGDERPLNGAGRVTYRQQPFTGGRMVIDTRERRAAPDPIQFRKGVRSKGLASFGADVHMHLHFDGTTKLFGHVSTDGEGYDWAISAIAQTKDIGIAMRKSGHLPGKVPEIGKRNVRHWHEGDLRLYRQQFFDLQYAKFDVHEKHDGDLTGVIDNVLATLLSWSVGAAAGPGTLLLIYAGVELGGLISKGDFGTGLRIVDGTAWMLLPGGYLLAIAGAAVKLGSRERGLTEQEREMANFVFKGTLDDVSIVLTDTGAWGKAFAFPSLNGSRITLNIGDGYRDGTPETVEDLGWCKQLIHELVHAWQWKHMSFGQEFVVDGVAARFQELFQGRHKTYDPGPIGKPWDAYHLEQQAEIVEQWFETHYKKSFGEEQGLASKAATTDPRFRYIVENIRTGRA